jgi:hypothetical protein
MVEDDMNNHLPLPPRQSEQLAQQNERQQNELIRNYEANRRYTEDQLRQREERVRQQYGDRLRLIIEQRCDVQDEQLKALAAEYLAKNLAAYVGRPDQNELTRVALHSLAQADEWQRDQPKQETTHQPKQQLDVQSRPEPELPRYSHHYHAEPRETRQQVDAAMAAEEVALDDDSGRGPIYRRYAPVEKTHREVAEASKPLNRSEREAQEAEAQLTAGEIGDAAQSRANRRLEGLRQMGQEIQESLQQAGLGLDGAD